MTPEECRARLTQIRRTRDHLEAEVQKIATDNVPDYHFLDYRVSMFWCCDKSPIGMCVFHLNDYGRETTCRYCGGPLERK